MTRRIDYDAVRRVVALAMEKLDATGPTDFVTKLGLTAEVPNAPRLAVNWIDGVNAPRFDYTLTMLSKAGLLTPEADRAWRGEAARPSAQAAAEESQAQAEAIRARRRRSPREETGT